MEERPSVKQSHVFMGIEPKLKVMVTLPPLVNILSTIVKL